MGIFVAPNGFLFKWPLRRCFKDIFSRKNVKFSPTRLPKSRRSGRRRFEFQDFILLLCVKPYTLNRWNEYMEANAMKPDMIAIVSYGAKLFSGHNDRGYLCARWLLNGHQTCLLLQRFEFQSCWSLLYIL